MPRKMILAPNHDQDKSLGWLATSWCEFFVRHGPGDVQGQPVHHGEEYTEFIVNMYAVGEHARNNHLLYDSIFLSRPKGAPAPAAHRGGGGRRDLDEVATRVGSRAGWCCGRRSDQPVLVGGRAEEKSTVTHTGSGLSTNTKKANRWDDPLLRLSFVSLPPKRTKLGTLSGRSLIT